MQQLILKLIFNELNYITLYNRYTEVFFFFISDTLTLEYNDKPVPLLRTQIAWESDKNIKYQNPKGDLKEGLLYSHFDYFILQFLK